MCESIVQSIVDKLHFVSKKGLPKIDFGGLADYANISWWNMVFSENINIEYHEHECYKC